VPAIEAPRVLSPAPVSAPNGKARSAWTADRPSTAVTLARLSAIPVILLTFLAQPVITTAAIAIFVIADVYDGVLARRRRRDDAMRRALDSAVDRVAIDVCFAGAYVAGALPLPLLLAFLARDIFLTALCAYVVHARRVIVKADWLYRALNLSVAAWAVAAPIVGSSARMWLAVALLAFSLVVARDLLRAVRSILASPPSVRDLVLDAGALRAG
jgi:phosphatidylglycerophosphate synthase